LYNLCYNLKIVPFIEQLENDILILKKIIFIQQGRIKMTKSEFLKDIKKNFLLNFLQIMFLEQKISILE